MNNTVGDVSFTRPQFTPYCGILLCFCGNINVLWKEEYQNKYKLET